MVDYLGIPLEKKISIGDGGNDLSMFEKSGIDVAMDNSISELKQNADRITLSNDEDGVAFFLKTHYKLDF